ncbi:MAG: hypothetical protein GY949_18775 [Gammaproteobacteria bacterium]|nr:hypothetical protein [Gammaproteobacteria bacterium]
MGENIYCIRSQFQYYLPTTSSNTLQHAKRIARDLNAAMDASSTADLDRIQLFFSDPAGNGVELSFPDE